jgi:hypothetical protein
MSWMPALSGAAIVVFGLVLGFDVMTRGGAEDEARFQAASVRETADYQTTEDSAPGGTIGEDDASGGALSGDAVERDVITPAGSAEGFEADGAARSDASTPSAAIAPPETAGDEAPDDAGEAPVEGATMPQAAEGAPPDEAEGPPIGADTANPPATGAPAPAQAPTPPAGNLNAESEAESCDAECMRDRRLEQISQESDDDGDTNRTWLLAAEIVAALVAVTAGAGAIAWWRRSKEY